MAVLVRSVRALGRGRRRQVRVVLSVASYVLDGAPVDDGRSIYGGLAPKRIGGLVAAAAAATIELEIVHDGTAGAYGVADPGPSAVVTVGTWLGIGFTPSSRPLLGGDPVVCS